MRSWQTLAIAVVSIGLASGTTQAQPRPAPYTLPTAPPQQEHRFPLNLQAGEWLICVQTFKGTQARPLAEEMAELLVQEYKLSPYLHDRVSKQRAEEHARVQAIRDKHWNNIELLQKTEGLDNVVDPRLRYRTMYYPDEYAVLVGRPNRPFKDMDAARDFLDDLRKMKPPPNKFANPAVFADDDQVGKKAVTNGIVYLNPFKTAMVVRNPLVPTKVDQADPTVADAFLKEMNANEPLSVLKCSKPWTLVVKIYQGQAVHQAPKSPSIMSRLGLGKKEPEILNASAAQAHSTAEFLRKMSPSFDAYVMHQRSYSLVTVGQFEGPSDPNLLAIQKSLAGLQIKNAGTGVVLETLNAQPLPMQIPR